MLLQEIVQHTEKTIPKYSTSSSQPFTSRVEVIIQDMKYVFLSNGAFTSKKGSEQSAARVCLESLAMDERFRPLFEFYRAEQRRRQAI